MTWVDLWESIEIFNRKRCRELNFERNILGAISGKDPRFIIELPGDWEGVPVSTPERVEKMMHKFKVHKKWIKEGVKIG